MSYEQMMHIGIGAGIVFLSVSIVLFFSLGVSSAIGELSGRTAKKRIEEMKRGTKRERRKKINRRTADLQEHMQQSTEKLDSEYKPGVLERLIKPLKDKNNNAVKDRHSQSFSVPNHEVRSAEIQVDNAIQGFQQYQESQEAQTYRSDGTREEKGKIAGIINSIKRKEKSKNRDEIQSVNTSFAIPGQEKKSGKAVNVAVSVGSEQTLNSQPEEWNVDEKKSKKSFFFRKKTEDQIALNNESAYSGAINMIPGSNLRQDYSLPGEGGTIDLHGMMSRTFQDDGTMMLDTQSKLSNLEGSTVYIGKKVPNDVIAWSGRSIREGTISPFEQPAMSELATLPFEFQIENHIVIVHTDERIQ